MTRLEILAKIDDLTDQHCKPCPDRPHYGESLNKCRGCPVYDEFRKCGDMLDKLIQEKRGVEPMTEVKQFECTKENYQKLRDEGKKMNEVADHLGISVATLYKHKNKWFSRNSEVKTENETEPSKNEVKPESEPSKDEGAKRDVNTDIKAKYIDQISDLNKRLTEQQTEHQKLIRNYDELSQAYAAAVKDKDDAIKRLTELQASKIDVDAMRSLLKSLL